MTLTNQQVRALRKVVLSPRDADDSGELQALRELLEDLSDTEPEETGHAEDESRVSDESRKSVASLLEEIRRRRSEWTPPPDYPGALAPLREDRAR